MPVVEGGTGASTIAQYNVVLGNATSAVAVASPSATIGVPFISQGAAANPVFGTAVVQGGGTGLTATTVGGMLLGTSTTAFTNLTIGANNTVLVSNGTTASWAAVPATAGVTSIAGTANQITASAPTGAVTLSIPSTFIAPGTIASTTSLTAGSGFTVTTGATTINSGTSAINIGTDASAKTTTIGTTTTTSKLALKCGTGGYTLDSATGNLVTALSTGETNYPLQPSFLSYLGTADANVTGNGATYTLGGGNALTEVFDQNSDISTAGIFTAPVTGRYLLIGVLRSVDIGTLIVDGTLSLVTSNRTYINQHNPAASSASTGGLTESIIVIADMDAADTAKITLVGTGAASNRIDINATDTSSYFSGQLLA